MSILIKGIEVPERCAECPFVICGRTSATDENRYWYKHIYNCRYKPEEIEDGWIDTPEALNGRQPWCPISEVPTPHGRLIDADGLMSTIKEHDYRLHDILTGRTEPGMFTFGIEFAVDNAPTIIEAEG